MRRLGLLPGCASLVVLTVGSIAAAPPDSTGTPAATARSWVADNGNGNRAHRPERANSLMFKRLIWFQLGYCPLLHFGSIQDYRGRSIDPLGLRAKASKGLL